MRKLLGTVFGTHRDKHHGNPAEIHPVSVARQYQRVDRELDRRVEDLLATIDLEGFNVLRAKYANSRPGKKRWVGNSKYLDIARWLRRHLVHAQALGLLDGPSRRILDLGTGNGYFPFICQQAGHRVVSVDVDNFDLYNDLVDFLGVKRRVLRIVRYQSLPQLGGPFDLVTAFNVGFDKNKTPDIWDVPEWDFFLRDLADNQLSPGGEIFLKLNPPRKPGGFDEKPLFAHFQELGAEIERNFVHFRPSVKLFK